MRKPVTSLRTLTRPHYSNIVMLNVDATPLATISAQRAAWYLKKDLASEVEPPLKYKRAIQLKFNNNIKQGIAHDLTVCEDKCVICASEESLTLHHCIPYVIRRHFPLKHKQHSRIWCVLLCSTCHVTVEEVTQPLYKMDFPEKGKFKRNRNSTLQAIKSRGHLNKLSPEKLALLLSDSDYKTVDDIPPIQVNQRLDLARIISKSHQDSIKEWAINFIKDNGGVEGTKKFFREIFLKMSPKFLPKGYLEID